MAQRGVLDGAMGENEAAFPSQLSRAQVIADVDNFTVVHNFRKGRARDATVHRLLRALFDLQRREGFWLRLRWVPSEANVEADSITWPGRDEFVRLRPHVFAELWALFGEFNIDLMASPVSAHCIPTTAQGAGSRLPFFTRYACDGSTGVDLFAQDVARVPGETARAFGFSFPPTALANPVVQHLAEQQAHAVVLLPSVAGLWGARMGCARKRCVTVASPGDKRVFFVDHQRAPQPYAFPDGIWLRLRSISPRSLGLSRRSGNASEDTCDTFGRMHVKLGELIAQSHVSRGAGHINDAWVPSQFSR